MVTKKEKMKKIKQTISAIILSLLITVPSFGQAIDQNRMDRDLKIAESILRTLSNSDKNNRLFTTQLEGNYVPGYGVILSYPNNTLNIRTSRNGRSEIIVYPSSKRTTNNVIQSNESDSYSYSFSTADDEDSKKNKIKEKIIVEQESKWMEKSKELFEEHASIFLVDYADLIGQLNASDKIMINLKGLKNNMLFFDNNAIKSQPSTGRTAEILKSDLTTYKQGKSTREAAIKKIKFTSSTKEDKVERDLELFGSIFAKLYGSDFSSTYYTTSHNVSYERLENFGAIFNMRVYSSSNNNGLHSIRTTRENGLTQEERNRKVSGMYPEFERSLKENILNYGRTIKSLLPNEILMFKIRLTECKACEMPKSIEVSVKASILGDYGSGKIDMDRAISAITINKVSN